MWIWPGRWMGVDSKNDVQTYMIPKRLHGALEQIELSIDNN